MVLVCLYCFVFFVFKQKTAYEMRISDWSSDVCSSDLRLLGQQPQRAVVGHPAEIVVVPVDPGVVMQAVARLQLCAGQVDGGDPAVLVVDRAHQSSEEHTSELQSLMHLTYAVFCLKKKKREIYAKMSKPL